MDGRLRHRSTSNFQINFTKTSWQQDAPIPAPGCLGESSVFKFHDETLLRYGCAGLQGGDIWSKTAGWSSAIINHFLATLLDRSFGKKNFRICQLLLKLQIQNCREQFNKNLSNDIEFSWKFWRNKALKYSRKCVERVNCWLLVVWGLTSSSKSDQFGCN